MKSIIINGNNFYLDQREEQVVVFIECPFSNQILDQLQSLSNKLELYIFVKQTNQYTKQNLVEERQAICTDPANAIVDNYYRYDLTDSQFDNYLDLNPVVETIETPTNRQQLSKLVELGSLLAEETTSNFVTEYQMTFDPAAENLLDLVFRNINADKIAITTDAQMYYKLDQSLSLDSQLVATSSNKVDAGYFYLPAELILNESAKLVLINQADYKYATQHLLDQKYIIDFKDDLRYSKYFVALCNQYQVTTTNQYQSQMLTPEQSITGYAIIDLIKQFNAVEIYHVVDNQLQLINQLTSGSVLYQKLVSEYKHSLIINKPWTISQSIINI